MKCGRVVVDLICGGGSGFHGVEVRRDLEDATCLLHFLACEQNPFLWVCTSKHRTQKHVLAGNVR